MEITRQADYAARAILYLAQHGAGTTRVSTAQIAAAQKIPPAFLAKIVAQLSAAGVVHATRGARGGIVLAKPPSEISLLEIVEAVDGPLSLNQCTQPATPCERESECQLHTVWLTALTELQNRLNQIHFDQFLPAP